MIKRSAPMPEICPKCAAISQVVKGAQGRGRSGAAVIGDWDVLGEAEAGWGCAPGSSHWGASRGQLREVQAGKGSTRRRCMRAALSLSAAAPLRAPRAPAPPCAVPRTPQARTVKPQPAPYSAQQQTAVPGPDPGTSRSTIHLPPQSPCTPSEVATYPQVQSSK